MRLSTNIVLVLSTAWVLLTQPQAVILGQQLPQLVRKETIPIKGAIGPSAMFVSPVSCDPEGNIYFYVYRSDYITEVSPDGNIAQKFSLASVPASYLKEPQKATILRYAVDQRGNIYTIVSDPGHGYLVAKFNSDGTFEDAFNLNVYGLFPGGLTPFPTGEILVTGVLETDIESGSPVPKPFAGIFDPYGKLLAKPSLAGDLSAEELQSGEKGQGDGSSAQTAASFSLRAAIATGEVAMGYDGNAYVFLNSSPPLVYVFSADGKLMRNLALKPPAKGLAPVSESLSGARIAVVFGAPAPQEKGATETMTVPEYYSVYDALTGDELAVYRGTLQLGAFACYDQNAFLFVGMNREGLLTLVKAKPE